MRVIGTIEARMGSSRLPGKTLKLIYKDMTLLECVVRRFQLCKQVNEIVVATSVSTQDDSIALWCRRQGIKCSRGSEENVLDRVVQALKNCRADAIVQMGADSAYLDFELIDQLVERYRDGDYDYVCNDMKLTYPLGIYGHVVNANTLVKINERLDLSEEDREDVVRYVFEHPEQYQIVNIESSEEFRYPELRFTIDYPEDLRQAQEIYAFFQSYSFTTADLIELYKNQQSMFERTKGLIQNSAAFLKKDDFHE